MRNAETVLAIIRERGKGGKPQGLRTDFALEVPIS
jgi:hypothetical protein